MPLLNFHFVNINDNKHTATGILRATNPRQTNWRIKYVGWSGTGVSILKIVLPFYNGTGHIQGFEEDNVVYPSTVAEGQPYFTFFSNGAELSEGSTISLYGSLSLDLNIGRIASDRGFFEVQIFGLNSAGGAEIIRSATVVMEYD